MIVSLAPPLIVTKRPSLLRSCDVVDMALPRQQGPSVQPGASHRPGGVVSVQLAALLSAIYRSSQGGGLMVIRVT
jgi:hypothetical protein